MGKRGAGKGNQTRPIDHYKVLDLPSTATAEVIQKARNHLLSVWHPDKNQGSEESHQRTASINEAFEILSNVSLRAAYDRVGDVSQSVRRTQKASSSWQPQHEPAIKRSRTGNKGALAPPIGTMVEAHSLSTDHLNGLRGEVLSYQGDRVVVAFPAPHGEKALKPENVREVLAAMEDIEESKQRFDTAKKQGNLQKYVLQIYNSTKKGLEEACLTGSCMHNMVNDTAAEEECTKCCEHPEGAEDCGWHFWFCIRCRTAQYKGYCINGCDWEELGWICIEPCCKKSKCGCKKSDNYWRSNGRYMAGSATCPKR